MTVEGIMAGVSVPRGLRCSLPILVLALAGASVLAHTDIPPSEVHDMIVAGEELIILDVREYYEFCGSQQHIENAANLPWNTNVLQDRYSELPTDAKIVVLCASGGRSQLAANFLDGHGFTDVYDMLGGMNAWAWETEGCDPEPVLRLSKDDGDVEIDWTPATGVQDYDLARGLVEYLISTADEVDLGPTDCLANDSAFTYERDAEVTPPQTTFFYLSRQTLGSWGTSSRGQERVPGLPGCS